MRMLVVLLLVPVLGWGQNKYTYKNLVLEGGGVRGLAYAGAFSELEKKGITYQLEKVAGTSAGAIAGLMISLSYNAREIDSIMRTLAIEDFNDGKGGLWGKYRRVRKKYGIYRGRKFENWLQQLIQHKTGNENLTFAGLHQLHTTNNNFKDFYCTATNISKQKLEIFSHEHTPDMSLAMGVRISGGIPLYFEPIILDDAYKPIQPSDTSSFRNYFVDGGMVANYPICIFDTCDTGNDPFNCDATWFNPQTLGIKLERPGQIDSLRNNSSSIPPFNINSLNGYIRAFNNLLIETLNRKYPNLENERNRTIYVSYGSIESKVRRVKRMEKEMLFNNGAKAAADFFTGK